MLYKMKSIDEHVDLGFGVTAESFKFSAEHLLSLERSLRIVQKDMPLLYLYRHSCELFLKSCIINFYHNFGLNWKAHKSMEYVFSYNGTHPISIFGTHSLEVLYQHLLEILDENRETINERYPNVEWDYINTLESKIKTISEYDDNSDYFRYGLSKNKSMDVESEKYTVKSIPVEELEKYIKPEIPSVFHIVVDSDNAPTNVNKVEDNILEVVKVKLIEVADKLEGFYLQTRNVFNL